MRNYNLLLLDEYIYYIREAENSFSGFPMANKLCVVFPGRRYSADRSLLYFPSTMMAARGFEVITLHYDISREIDETLPIDTNIEQAEKYARDFLKDVSWEKYDSIVFLSKSIGTVVSSHIKNDLGEVKDRIHQILLTPLYQAFLGISKCDLIIAGDNDCFLRNTKEVLTSFPNAIILPSSNHSLETTGDYKQTIQTLEKCLSSINLYLKRLEVKR